MLVVTGPSPWLMAQLGFINQFFIKRWCCVLEQICGTDMAASAIYGLWSRELASVAGARIRARWVPGR